MISPQTGIFALGTSSHTYLEFDLVAGAEPAAAVARVASLREPRTTIGGVNVVAGFRPELWAGIAPDDAPPGLTGFNEPLVGPTGYALPATQHDVVVWLNGATYDVVFDLSRAVQRDLRGVADLANEMVGFQYHHDLDLTGFIDGIENPTLVEATSVALIPEGPGTGGSVLLAPAVGARRERPGIRSPFPSRKPIIGRRKSDGAELDPAPESSHVGRTDQEEFGKIFRRNVAYGTLARHGTIFVGFSRDQGILQAMLESMIGRRAEAIDRLTTVTRPVTGAYYMIPSADALAARGDDRRTDDPEEP